MKLWKKAVAAVVSAAMLCSAAAIPSTMVQATDTVEDAYSWSTLRIGGGGFVSGIVTGQKEMYLRTDVGGAYKYNYETNEWEQLFGFLTDAERGFLSVDAMAIDPTDDNTVYFLCGCAYFSDARTEIIKTTDGGKTFTRVDVTDLIQVHGNGDGRECVEAIAIDPDNPDTIYCGGDVASGASALIKSTDGGLTWNPVKGYDDLGLFSYSIKWPMWTDHMTRAVDNGEYNTQNGIGTIYIEGGKVYVGTDIAGVTNIHVADVKDDVFTELSADLPTDNYPLSITSDHNGNLFFTYIAGLAFGGGAGGAYKYNVASGTVTDISPSGNAFGMITVDKDDPNLLLTRTCGVWSDQWYEEEWTDGSIAWGDYFYRSTDGGETWINITPGQKAGDWGEEYFISNPIDTNGYDWIYGKACHWGSGILLDPRDSDRILMTSGNGVFACDNVWDEKGVQFYFMPDGVEEVVALDMVSVPGGAAYSAIGDYDGFVHVDADSIPQQYVPNIGSTSGIAYCPSDPKVMSRVGEHEAKGYYSLDGGKTWEDLNVPNGGGKLAITQLADGTYRFFKASGDNASLSYTDDFGATWKEASGLKGTSTAYTLVDLNDPSKVYAYAYNYNSYWASNPALTEPSFEEAHYSVFFSDDYGATFKETELTRYDMCDHCGDLAYITEDTIAAAAGYNGMYIITENGSNAEKTDVAYCKSIGYGAPEKEGGPNTLFIYGRPTWDDEEGIYRSTDMGKTWVCINTQHIYGGTGNGNFLVGDMNEFGKVYMSTVGCGIVYGEITGAEKPQPSTQPDTTEAPKETTEDTPTEEVTGDDTGNPDAPDTTGGGAFVKVDYGDVDESGAVDIVDVIVLNKHLLLGEEISDQGTINADVDRNGTVNATDSLNILKAVVKLVTLPVE